MTDDTLIESCNNCHFWKGGRIDTAPSFGVDDAASGKCRRRAPLATGGLHGSTTTEWPTTGISDWCGDYALRAQAGEKS